MIEYIRRADALKAMDCGNLHKGIVDALQSLILDVPAADVKPVRYGEWVKPTILNGCVFPEMYHCSLCGMSIRMEKANYCSNCGADMREVAGDEDT